MAFSAPELQNDGVYYIYSVVDQDTIKDILSGQIATRIPKWLPPAGFSPKGRWREGKRVVELKTGGKTASTDIRWHDRPWENHGECVVLVDSDGGRQVFAILGSSTMTNVVSGGLLHRLAE